jgi:hypothetical protein
MDYSFTSKGDGLRMLNRLVVLVRPRRKVRQSRWDDRYKPNTTGSMQSNTKMKVASDLQQRNRIIPFTNSIHIKEMCQILIDLSLPFITRKIPLYIKSNSLFQYETSLKVRRVSYSIKSGSHENESVNQLLCNCLTGCCWKLKVGNIMLSYKAKLCCSNMQAWLTYAYDHCPCSNNILLNLS